MINKKLIKYCTMQYVILLFTANIYSMEYNIYNSGIEHSGGLPNICEHPSNNRPYKCEVEGCGYSAKTKVNLNQHMRTHSNNRSYKCKVKCCGYYTRTKDHLRMHMRCHSNDRPYICEVEGCDYSAKTKNHLRIHMRCHSNDRPYKCKAGNCSSVFKTSSDLKRHMLRHIGAGVYKCNFENCNYSTSDQSTLARHITLDHNTYNDDGIQYPPLNMYSANSNITQVMFPTSNSVNEEFSIPVLNSEQNTYWPNHDNYNDNLQVSLDTSQTLGSPSTSTTYNPVSQMPFNVGNLNGLNYDNANLNTTTSSENYNYSTSDQSTLVKHITSDHNTSNSDLSTKDDQITSMVTSIDVTPISSNIVCKEQSDKANTKIKHSLFKTKYKCKQCQFITYNMQDIISHHVGHKN